MIRLLLVLLALAFVGALVFALAAAALAKRADEGAERDWHERP